MKERIVTTYKVHKRFLIILAGIIILNLIYGWDARFTTINLLWILINVIKF